LEVKVNATARPNKDSPRKTIWQDKTAPERQWWSRLPHVQTAFGEDIALTAAKSVDPKNYPYASIKTIFWL
jgi:hypothetical protein